MSEIPFGKYTDFQDCVAKNKGKVSNPKAYCATIERRMKGKGKDYSKGAIAKARSKA